MLINFLTERLFPCKLPEKKFHFHDRKGGLMSSNVIAIDGPAASGKSTVARRLSEALGIAYINTGALYRAVAWKLYRCGLDPYSVTPGQVDQVLAETTISYEKITPDAPLEIKIDGVFPGTELRRAEISAAASKVATMPNVRAWLLDLQRGMAKLGRIVMEGRDIGTAVFPDAQFKFFLTASPLVRARRRLSQSGETVDGATLESVARDIAARDEQDSNRAVAPLRRAEDAVFVDNSEWEIEQTLQFMLDQIKEKDAMEKETVLTYRVPYADTDQMGVVYYANYLKYFEMFRSEMLIDAGLSYLQMEKEGIAMPVIEAVCRYKSSAHFEDRLSITGRVAEAKGVRVKIECEVRCGDRILADGYTIHACMDMKTGRPTRVPAALLKLLK